MQDGAVWQRVRLITSRSRVQIPFLHPLIAGRRRYTAKANASNVGAGLGEVGEAVMHVAIKSRNLGNPCAEIGY